VDSARHKTGEMKVRFAVASPDALVQKAFEDYVADKFKLTCEPAKAGTIPKTVFLTLGKWTDRQWDCAKTQPDTQPDTFLFFP
jgi:hypothetical protein